MYSRKGSNPSDPKFTSKYVKHSASLMVQECFTYHGVGKLLTLVQSEKVNQNNNLELLSDELWFFWRNKDKSVHVGFSSCTCCSVTQWLTDCEVPFFLTGLEVTHISISLKWSHLKKQLLGMDTSSVPELNAAVKQIWASFSPSYLQSLTLSVCKCLEIIKRRLNGKKNW